MKAHNFVVLLSLIHNAKFNMMKNENVISKDSKEAINYTPLSSSKKAGFVSKIGKQMKKFILIGSVAGIGLFLNSCMAGYVATEPTYSEYSRPERPSELHVWIDGDWVYNQSSHVYVQRNGYWARPQQNRVYIQGSWESSPKGKHWNKGRWERSNNQQNRRSR